MANRTEKIKELMQSFQALRRSGGFRHPGSAHFPRVTPSQWGVLMCIGQREGSTVKDIAGSLRISSSAATQLIDGLVTSGYIVRKADIHDRRRVTLVPSAKTKSQIEKMRKQSVEQFLKFFRALNDQEFDQYIALTKKISDQFQP